MRLPTGAGIGICFEFRYSIFEFYTIYAIRITQYEMIIVDGYNLLWVIHKAGDEPGEISDVQVCRLIGRYLELTGERGEIVFDGTGPPDKSGFDNIASLEVLFAGLGVDADSIIEDKIRANTAPRRLTVVSDDRRLRKAAKARKATALKSEDFWKRLHKQLNRKVLKREPTAKQTGLTESETKQWLKFFGLEQ